MKKEREGRMTELTSPPSRPELSDTPVKFCNEISRLFRSRMREMDEPGAMSQPGAGLILSMLAMNDGINQRQLVQATHFRPPTVSVALKKMEADGVVELRNDPEDLRAVRVYLTEQGRRLDRENIEKIRQLDEIALRGLTEQEIRQLMELLTRIRNNFLSNAEENKEENEEK